MADYSHYFLIANSSIPIAPINNEICSTICLKSSLFRSSIYVDMGVSASIGHLFQVQNPGVALLSSLNLNGATSDYFSFLTTISYLCHGKGASNYIKLNWGKGRRRGNGGSGGTITTTTTSSSTEVFSLSNVEASLQMEYETGHLALRPEGNLFFPLEAGLGVASYWQLNVQYNF